MPTPFFGLNNTSSSPTVRRYLGLSATTVGNTFGSAEVADARYQPLNRVIQFGSQNTFLALLNGNVYRSTNTGTTWTSVFSVSTSEGTTTSGLNVIYRNGIPTVCFVWGNVGNTAVFGSYSTNGINWTTNNSVASASQGSYQKDTIFRNTLYSLPPYHTFCIGYSPGADVGKTDLPGSGPSSSSSSLCVFNDQLVILVTNNFGNNNKNIYSLSGGAWVFRATLSTGNHTGTTGKTGMFVDSNSGELIVFTRNASLGAWTCWRVNSSWTPVNISSAVLPAGMLLGSIPDDAQIITSVDGAASPGTNPSKYIIYTSSSTAGSILSLFRWEGISTPMSDIDSGSTVREAFTVSNDCQGVGNWSSGENSVELINRSPVSGGVRLFFKLYSISGNTNVSVRAWFGSQFHEYPLTQATIIDPSNGTIVANVNSGVAGPPGPTTVVADNGATTYYFTWNNAADGIPVGDRFRLILEVFV